MNGCNRIAIALALGASLAGVAVAQTPDLAQPEPTPAATALTTSVNANSLKAIFEAANVPVEVHTTDKGYSYLSGRPLDYTMFVYPLDCEGSSLDGNCKAFAMESALWNAAIGVEKANAYNQKTKLATAVVYDNDAGKPVIEYVVAIDSGVGPDYLRTTLRYFTYGLQDFHQYLNDLSQAAPAPPSGFSVKPAGRLLTSTPRAGSRVAEGATAGEDDFGPGKP